MLCTLNGHYSIYFSSKSDGKKILRNLDEGAISNVGPSAPMSEWRGSNLPPFGTLFAWIKKNLRIQGRSVVYI